MFKTVLMTNMIKGMNYLPLMERWLLREHCGETIGQVGSWLARYLSYRAVPAPPEAEPYGYYNWRVTELWWREPPPPPGGVVAEAWPPNYSEILGLPKNVYRTHEWHGQPKGPHPPVSLLIPPRATEDFLGSKLTIGEKTILRWYIALKYPDGVPVEEGEKWFLEVHSKEVMQQPGITRYFSYRTMAPPGRPASPWVRVVEQWYEDFDGWRKSILDSPPQYTKPPWAKYDKYPFLEPYLDFVSTFVLEKPTNDWLRDYNGYVPAV